MRRALTTFVALCVGAVSSCAVAKAIWLVEGGHLTRLDPELGITQRAPVVAGVRNVAPTASGGAWVATEGILTRLDGALEPAALTPLSPAEAATFGPMAAERSDDGLWAALGATLVRFDAAGSRVREVTFESPPLAIAVAGPEAVFVATATALVRVDGAGAVGARADFARLPGSGVMSLLADPLAGYVWLVRTGAVIQFDALQGLRPRASIVVAGPDAADVELRSGTLTLVSGQRIERFDRDGRAILPGTFASEPFVDLAGIDGAPRDPLLWFGDRIGFGIVGLGDGAIVRLAGSPSVERLAVAPPPFELRLDEDLSDVAAGDTSTPVTLRFSLRCEAVECVAAPAYLHGMRLHAYGGDDDLSALFGAGAASATFTASVPTAPWQVAPPLRAWVTDPWGNRSTEATVTWPIKVLDPRRHAMSAPTVAITAPVTGSIYTAPLTTTIKATATPGTGAAIAKVEFLSGAKLLGTVTASPYNLVWPYVQAGTYALTAKVTDSLGGTATSAVVNVAVNAGARAAAIDAWLFNDAWATAGVAVDAAGMHNATPTGTLTAVTSAPSLPKPDTCKAASFGGGAFDVAGLAVSTAAAAKTTIAFWMYWTGTDNVIPIGWVGEALILSGGSFGFGTQNGDVFGVASTGLANAWHHVVAEFTNGAVASNKLYVDGVPQTLTQRAGAPNNANAVVATSLRIGGLVGSASNRFGGQLDEVRLFNRALTATEVSAEFAAANACGSAPTATLTAPVDNANFVAPASIALAATAAATATGATLTKVEFYNGATLLAADATSPYAYAWSNVPIGDYALTAKATDSKGTTATSTIATAHVKANVAPTVTITAPANNSAYTAPATINLAATAADSDGTVTKVEFYQGSTRLATVTAPPYTYAWTNVAGGSYALTAKATDDKGAVTTSAVINVKVNKPPTISITAPANNATFVLPVSITIGASASDADGTIGKVEFYRDGVLLAADTTSPYSYVWTPAAAGTYVLTAKATDNLGAATASAAVTVTVNVNQPPTVSIANPTAGSLLVAGSVVTIAATAADADGTIAKVEFYCDGVLLGADTTAPYGYAWTTAAPGTHVLAAKATDNKGGTAMSPPVTVTAVANQPPTVSLTAPTDGQFFISPSALPNIVLSAAASDPDGTVSAVRFYKQAEGVNGDPEPVLLGTATAAPYQVTWASVPYTDPPPGGVNVDYYLVWAEATDDHGDVTVSDTTAIQVLQTAPPSSITAAITSPYSYLGVEPVVFRAPATIMLAAGSSFGSGSISKIEFVANGVVVGTATAPSPYDDQFRALWRNVPAGTYALSAKLTDLQGLVSTSAAIAVNVIVPNPPAVTLQAPVGEQIVPMISGVVPQAIPYSAMLSDPAGVAARVEFDDNARLLAWPAAPPYSGTVSAPERGLHVITARALDARYRELARSSSAYALVGVAARQTVAVMTSPAPGTSYGGVVLLTVDAVAPDSTIARVDFYSGNWLLGSATAPPYSINASFNPGVQSVYAVVSAPFTATAVTAPVTFTVTGAASGTGIKLSSPIEGQRFNAPANIPLAVTLNDPGRIITRVEYYWTVNINGGLIASSTQAPWTATWSGVGVGEYWVTAVGIYAGGRVTSAPVHFSVATPLPVVLTAPTDGSMVAPGQAIAMTAQANTPGQALARVDFIADGAVVGSVPVTGGPSAATVSYSWSGAATGVHILTAKAFTSGGSTNTSAAVTIDVTDLAVTLAEPYPGQAYQSPADIRITAGPVETGGAIAQVDFYGDGVFLGTRTAAPYSFVWTGVPIGAHTVSAKVRDAAGFVAGSTAVGVTSLAAPTIAIDAGIDGSSVADDNASISGTVHAPMNSAVVVNGKGAALDRNGRFFVDGIPLQPGTNTVTVALNNQDGSPATRIITLGSTGTAPFQVTVDPQEGLAPLSATMTITNRGKVAFQRIEIDINDDGTPEQTLTALTNNEVQVDLSFPNPGPYVVRVRVVDAGNGVIYSTVRRILAHDPRDIAGIAGGVFQTMLDRLGAGNIAGAMTAITGSMQDKYQAIFGALQPSLQTIVSQVGTIQWINVTDELAEIGLFRNGANGPQTFQVYVLRSEDGVWRIDGM